MDMMPSSMGGRRLQAAGIAPIPVCKLVASSCPALAGTRVVAPAESRTIDDCTVSKPGGRRRGRLPEEEGHRQCFAHQRATGVAQSALTAGRAFDRSERGVLDISCGEALSARSLRNGREGCFEDRAILRCGARACACHAGKPPRTAVGWWGGARCVVSSSDAARSASKSGVLRGGASLPPHEVRGGAALDPAAHQHPTT